MNGTTDRTSYLVMMSGWMNSIWKLIHAWLNRLLVKLIDTSESNEVVKIVTKEIGLAWVEMVNHVEITNNFFIPYTLEEVKLTYYNDAKQNIGYLHFKGPVRIRGNSTKLVKMPAKMSNITALFNAARMLINEHVKTQTIGYSKVRILGISFELPINDVMSIDKDKVVSWEEDEELRAIKLKERARKEAERQARKAKRKSRRAARKRLLRMKQKKQHNKQAPKEKPMTKSPAPEIDRNTELIDPEAESSTPDPDRSYSDQ